MNTFRGTIRPFGPHNRGPKNVSGRKSKKKGTGVTGVKNGERAPEMSFHRVSATIGAQVGPPGAVSPPKRIPEVRGRGRRVCGARRPRKDASKLRVLPCRCAELKWPAFFMSPSIGRHFWRRRSALERRFWKPPPPPVFLSRVVDGIAASRANFVEVGAGHTYYRRADNAPLRNAAWNLDRALFRRESDLRR